MNFYLAWIYLFFILLLFYFTLFFIKLTMLASNLTSENLLYSSIKNYTSIKIVLLEMWELRPSSCSLFTEGNATSPQVQRPSFMDYFDKQDFKNKSHENCNQNVHEPFPMSKNVFPDNWKVPQDGDFDFVSTFEFSRLYFLLYFIVRLSSTVSRLYNTIDCILMFSIES